MRIEKSRQFKKEQINDLIRFTKPYLNSKNKLGIPDFVLSSHLYNYITRRRSGAEYKKIKQAYLSKGIDPEKQYALFINSLQKKISPGLRFERAGASPWVTITPAAFAKSRLTIGESKVSFKDYFTVLPKNSTHQGAINELKLFFDSLPEIAERLNRLSNEHNDFIQLKVPDHFSVFLMHLDNLVVHYKTPGIGPKIRKIIAESLSGRNLEISRPSNRVYSGFDFSSPDGEKAGLMGTMHKLAGSHSELISRLVASSLKVFLNQYPHAVDKPDYMAKVVDGLISKYSNMTYRQMYAELKKSTS